jgi:hypothetical protein
VTARAGGALALAALLLVALALRLWGIHYGLPWLFYFHDEPQVVLRALRFGTGDLNPHFFIWPGALLLWLAFFAYGGLYVVGHLAGWWRGAAAFAAAYFQDPTAFYVLARLESVAFGVWGVWLAYRLGREAAAAPRAAGPAPAGDGAAMAVGFAVAAGLGLNAVHAHYSHFAHPVTWMTAFTLLGLVCAVRVAHGAHARTLYAGAVAAGLGASAQYHGALAVVPLAVAVLYRAFDPAPAGGARWIRHGVLACALAGATFLVVCPYAVLDFRTFRADIAWISAKTGGELTGTVPAGGSGLAGFIAGSMIPAFGLPLAIAAALGCVLALVRRRRASIVMLAFAVAYLLLASRSAVRLDRYAVPLLGVALCLAADVILALVSRLRVPGAAGAWLVPAAVVLLCAPSALDLIETDYTMTRDDTRVEAKRWFEAHAAPDDRVVIDMTKFWNSASPPLAENRERVAERLALVERGVSGAGHSAAYADYYRFQLDHPRRPSYYLRGTDLGNDVRTPDEYRRDGFRWAIVSGDAVRLQEDRATRGDSTGVAYYHALEREAALAAEFRPERWKRRGPAIRIYRLDPPPR